MTLIVAIVARKSIWLLADRRLSRSGKPFKDDANKVMFLETTDGVAILGYAGLGATQRGTEPSAWMSEVLRGRNWPMEQSLRAVADAIQREIPPQFARTLGDASHVVLAPAFVDGTRSLYAIGLALLDGRETGFRFSTLRSSESRSRHARPVAASGSGALHLPAIDVWMRPTLRLIRAFERGKISAELVADHLAQLNYEVHSRDPLVGPDCLVAWRLAHRGGAHLAYQGTRRVETPLLPVIGRGMDVSQIVKILIPFTLKSLETLIAAPSETCPNGVSSDIDEARANEALRRGQWDTNEKLR